jgi:5-formyltetrahydrofolate cyclo-ligase
VPLCTHLVEPGSSDLPTSSGFFVNIIEEKRALRSRKRALLASLPPRARREGGARVAAPLLARAGPGPVALFASLPDEIETAPLDEALRDAGLPRAAPRVEEDGLVLHLIPGHLALGELEPGVLGIPTPSASWPRVGFTECALVVVPALAVDRRGRRLGRGKGYYDRALAGVDPARVVGLVLDEQLVEAVPVEPHDTPLAHLCTPALGVISAGG